MALHVMLLAFAETLPAPLLAVAVLTTFLTPHPPILASEIRAVISLCCGLHLEKCEVYCAWPQLFNNILNRLLNQHIICNSVCT